MTLASFDDLLQAMTAGLGFGLAFGMACLFIGWAISVIVGLFRAAL